jgi:hypothetical protein
LSAANVTPFSEQSNTLVNSPNAGYKFATRRLIKIVAVVCECGRVSHGPGVKKWRKCPRCGAHIISSRHQRQRDSYAGDECIDGLIQEQYEAAVVQR